MNEDRKGLARCPEKGRAWRRSRIRDRDSFSKLVTEQVRKEFVEKFGSDVLDAILKGLRPMRIIDLSMPIGPHFRWPTEPR